MVEILLNHGCAIEAESSMKRRPIHLAALKGNLKLVDYLVSCGGEISCVDIDNNTPLIFASRLGYEDLVEYLLIKHADFSIKNMVNETALDVVCNIKINNVPIIILNY
jgi:ankyrin repeat protein